MNRKIYLILATLIASCCISNLAYANHQTVFIGYVQSKVAEIRNLRGVNLQYRYEWNSPLSILGSVSYTKGSDVESAEAYISRLHFRSYTLMIGPAYRINNYVSLYLLAGTMHLKVNDDTVFTAPDSEAEHDSFKYKTFAYGAGVIINPSENFSVNIGYQGARFKGSYGEDQHYRFISKGFNISLGYRF